MNFISCLARSPSAMWLQLYDNKTRKRRRDPLFFLPVFLRFLLNTTANRKTVEPDPDGELAFYWQLTIGLKGCQYELFWLRPTVKRELWAASSLWLLHAPFLCQYVNKTGFRTCVKELFVQQHDPLLVSCAVSYQVRNLWNSATMSLGILINDYETIFNEAHPDGLFWHIATANYKLLLK